MGFYGGLPGRLQSPTDGLASPGELAIQQRYADRFEEYKNARSNHDANDDAGCIQQSKFARQLVRDQSLRPLTFAIRTHDIVASLRQKRTGEP